MEDFLERIKSLFPGGKFSVEWLTGLLSLMVVYALGYFCGLLPSLLHRRRRKFEDRSAILCADILGKIYEHEDLYDQYTHEADTEKRNQLAREITVVREDVKHLEFRLAMLERRRPRRLPLRPLPVRHLEIE